MSMVGRHIQSLAYLRFYKLGGKVNLFSMLCKKGHYHGIASLSSRYYVADVVQEGALSRNHNLIVSATAD